MEGVDPVSTSWAQCSSPADPCSPGARPWGEGNGGEGSTCGESFCSALSDSVWHSENSGEFGDLEEAILHV